MKRFDQSGSHVIGLALFVAFVAVVGFTGYKVWQLHSSVATSNSLPTIASKVPATIRTSSDLTQAANALDAASAQLNANLNDATLNTDMQSML